MSAPHHGPIGSGGAALDGAEYLRQMQNAVPNLRGPQEAPEQPNVFTTTTARIRSQAQRIRDLTSGVRLGADILDGGGNAQGAGAGSTVAAPSGHIARLGLSVDGLTEAVDELERELIRLNGLLTGE